MLSVESAGGDGAGRGEQPKSGARLRDVTPPDDDGRRAGGHPDGGSRDGRHARLASSVVDAIGETPAVELARLTRGLLGRIVATLEYLNPGFSKKDRIAHEIVDEAAGRGPLAGRRGGAIALTRARSPARETTLQGAPSTPGRAGGERTMTLSERAGRPADPRCWSTSTGSSPRTSRHPRPVDPGQRVAFGTSGHRGSSLPRSFNEAHIVAATAAVARYRRRRGTTGRSSWAATPTPSPSRPSRRRSRCSSPGRGRPGGRGDGFTRRRRSPTRSCRKPRPRRPASPTGSWSRPRTTRPRTAASSTTRPTAARPTRT